MTEPLKLTWGRVDDTGSVYVNDGDSERLIGQLPDGTPDEAVAYFTRKYDDLVIQIDVVEQRIASEAPAKELRHSLDTLAETLKEPAVFGDIAALRTRVSALAEKVAGLADKQSEQAKAEHDQSLAHRTEIAESMERIAAMDPAKVQWKQTSKQVEELFAEWQRHQREGARLTKSEADALWKRFRAARSTFERNRRAFFASLDAEHKQVKERKEYLVKQVEALVPQGAAATGEYQRLLQEWKRSGRAGKKTDDKLWSRFKAAGDEIYAAKAQIIEQENAEYEKNLVAKKELLEEAEKLTSVKDHNAARKELTRIQRQWEEIGRVPRAQFRAIEGRLQKVEAAIRSREDEHWNRTDPEKQARSESMESQLEDIIGKLEAEVEQAKASGDKRRIEKATEDLEARRAWLNALRQ